MILIGNFHRQVMINFIHFQDFLKRVLCYCRLIIFSIKQEAVEKRYSAGSTASVVLLLNDEELQVANVGDSKVILCSGRLLMIITSRFSGIRL